MLYHAYTSQRLLLTPLAQLARASAALLASPLNPLAAMPWAASAVAGWELLHRLSKPYDKQAFSINDTTVDGRSVALRQEVVLERPFCRLLHFAKIGPVPSQGRVLLVAPLAGHHATLLRDTVRELVRDHDVWLTDWIDARQVPLAAGRFGLAEYVDYMRGFMCALGPGLHVVAICQSTVPVLAACALLVEDDPPAAPASITMIGGPIDVRRSPTEVNRLAATRPLAWFRQAMIDRVPFGFPGWGRRVYPGFVQHACFVAMNAARHAQSHREFYQQRCRGESAARHRAFYDEYNAVLDMTEEFYLETVDVVFQRCLLARGLLHIDGRPVRLEALTATALLTVEGERDDITGIGQTAAALELCGAVPASMKHSLVAAGCGHYAIFSGAAWRRLIYPRVREFIAAYGR
jgi:poly(3-hydroxybutyrate) depolymerase